jgi:hypothetical protein
MLSKWFSATAIALMLVLVFDAGALARNANPNQKPGTSMTFRSFTTPKSPTGYSRDSMIALADVGFNQGLQFLNGQPPSIAVTGQRQQDNAAALIVCAQNKDVVFFLFTQGTPIDPIMVQLAKKWIGISNRH